MTPEPHSKSTKTSPAKKTSANRSWRNYLALTKPGIIRGNLLMAAAGFLLASDGHITLWTFLSLLAGTSLIIASGCVCNNIIDRSIDAKMERTRHRALVQGAITPKAALLFATMLGVVGLFVLAIGTNLVTLMVGIVGFVSYVFLYGYAKRNSVYGTHVGSISGATPPLAGYVAVTGKVDLAAVLLFGILAFWQMPHFFAIALYRKKDYVQAGIPAMPTVQRSSVAQWRILGYIIAYALASVLLSVTGYTGYVYAACMILLCAYWFWLGSYKLRNTQSEQWGKRMFLFSLVTLLAQSVLLAANWLLP